MWLGDIGTTGHSHARDEGIGILRLGRSDHVEQLLCFD
jgi:hypothetical protein